MRAGTETVRTPTGKLERKSDFRRSIEDRGHCSKEDLTDVQHLGKQKNPNHPTNRRICALRKFHGELTLDERRVRLDV